MLLMLLSIKIQRAVIYKNVKKPDNEFLDINLFRMSNELIKINDKKFQTFRSDKNAYDMWIYIDLNDYDYEIAALNYIC